MVKAFEKIILILGTIVIIVGLALFGLTLTDYSPEEVMDLTVENNQDQVLSLNKELTALSYNIGYGGLDRGQDFFADGGKRSRGESKEKVEENLEGIWKNIEGLDPDFLLLQEVDLDSSRSYRIDQLDYFKDLLGTYGHVYGTNYRAPWVPVPLLSPMGKAESGIASFSKYQLGTAVRYDLPGKEKWPVQLFELDRCFTESILHIEGGGELVLINLHLSAFDEGGRIRKEQLAYLKRHLEDKYKRGSHILVGGDWNHNLPGTDPYNFDHKEEWPFWLKDFPEDFNLDGFTWALDPSKPTVRTLAQEYVPGYNFLASIDGFLISDNIDLLKVEVLDDQFRYSDHNPVSLSFILR